MESCNCMHNHVDGVGGGWWVVGGRWVGSRL